MQVGWVIHGEEEEPLLSLHRVFQQEVQQARLAQIPLPPAVLQVLQVRPHST